MHSQGEAVLLKRFCALEALMKFCQRQLELPVNEMNPENIAIYNNFKSFG